MIREQRDHVAAVAEHFLGKSLQRLLRPDFDEDARARGIERLQSLHKLHRTGDLERKKI